MRFHIQTRLKIGWRGGAHSPSRDSAPVMIVIRHYQRFGRGVCDGKRFHSAHTFAVRLRLLEQFACREGT